MLPAQAAPRTVLSVDDASGCLTAPAMEVPVEEAVPLSWHADAREALAVTVQVEVHGTESHVHLRASAGDVGAPVLVERVVPFVRADCPELPRLLGAILARALAELPREQWPRRRVEQPPSSAAADGRWVIRLSVVGGLDVGLDEESWAGRLDIAVGVGPEGAGLHLLTGLALSAGAPVPVGAGSAQLTAALFVLGAGLDLDQGGWTLTPTLGLAGGLAVSTGLDFDTARTVVGPAARGFAGLSLSFDFGLIMGAELSVSLVRTRLTEQDSGASRLEPAARLGVTAGYRGSF